jgi:hypothetical protein
MFYFEKNKNSLKKKGIKIVFLKLISEFSIPIVKFSETFDFTGISSMFYML